MRRKTFFLSFIFISIVILNGCQDYSKKAAQNGLEIMAKENPSKLLPNRCTLSPGLVCEKFKVADTEIEITLLNGLGNDIKNIRITVDSCQEAGIIEGLKSGEKGIAKLIYCKNKEASKDGVFRKDIIIDYIEYHTTLPRKGYGMLFYKLE